jgi:multidrug efflux pump subunit AcrB
LPVVLSFLNFDKKSSISWTKDNNINDENKLFLKLEWFFKFTIRNYKKSILSFVLLFFVTLWFASQFLKADFLPPVDTNNIYINLKFSSDISLQENKKIVSDISSKIDKYFNDKKWLLAYQGINIWDYKSLDPLDNVIYGNSFNPDLAYIDLKLTDKDLERSYESYSIVQDLKEVIKKEDFSDKLESLEIFIQKSWPSWGKDVNFYLVWDNLESLVNFYNKIELELKNIDWTFDWSNSLEYTNWKFDITWDIQKLKQFNLTTKELDLLIASIENTTSYEPNWILITKLDDFGSDLIEVKAFTKTKEDSIFNIIIPWRDIYLKQLVKDIKLVWEVKSLIHADSKLILNVWAYKTKETSLWSITPYIEEYVEEYSKEIPWVTLEYAWDVKDMQNSMSDLMKAFWIWIMLMFSVLVLHFWNFRQPFLVLSVIPFLFIWAILLLTISGLPFSFPAQLWMFGLMWVWVNDAILLIERYNSEVNKKHKDIDKLILNVIKSRFKPVLLTTLTTVLWLSTLAIKDDLWWSLAIAFIWWLLLWTFIILVYIPAMLKWGLVRNNK